MDTFLSAINTHQKKCSCGKARCQNKGNPTREFNKDVLAQKRQGICGNQTCQQQFPPPLTTPTRCYTRYPPIPIATSTTREGKSDKDTDKTESTKELAKLDSGSNTSSNDEYNYTTCKCPKKNTENEDNAKQRKSHKYYMCKNSKCRKRIRRDADHTRESFKHDVKATSALTRQPDHSSGYHRYVHSTQTAQNYPGCCELDHFPPLPVQAIIQSHRYDYTILGNEREVIGYTPGQYEYAGPSYPPLANSRKPCSCVKESPEKSTSSSSQEQDEGAKARIPTAKMFHHCPTTCKSCCRKNMAITKVVRPRSKSVMERCMVHEIGTSPIPIRALRTQPPRKNCHTYISPSFSHPSSEDVFLTPSTSIETQQVTIPNKPRGYYMDKSFVTTAEPINQNGRLSEERKVKPHNTKCKCGKKRPTTETFKMKGGSPKIHSTKSVLIRYKPPVVDCCKFKPCPAKCKAYKKDAGIRSETVDRYPKESRKASKSPPSTPATETLYMRSREMNSMESNLYVTPEEETSENTTKEIVDYDETTYPESRSEPITKKPANAAIVKRNNTTELFDTAHRQRKQQSPSFCRDKCPACQQIGTSKPTSTYATPNASMSNYDTPSNGYQEPSKGSIPKSEDKSGHIISGTITARSAKRNIGGKKLSPTNIEEPIYLTPDQVSIAISSTSDKFSPKANGTSAPAKIIGATQEQMSRKISSLSNKLMTKQISKLSNGMKDEESKHSFKFVICDAYAPKRKSPPNVNQELRDGDRYRTATTYPKPPSIASSILTTHSYATANSSKPGSTKFVVCPNTSGQSKQVPPVIKIEKIEKDLRSLSAKSSSIPSSHYLTTKNTQSSLSEKVSSRFTSFHSAHQGDTSEATTDENMRPTVRSRTKPHSSSTDEVTKKSKKTDEEKDDTIMSKFKWSGKAGILNHLRDLFHHPYARKLLKSLLFFLLGLKVCSEAWYMVIPIYGMNTAIVRCSCPD